MSASARAWYHSHPCLTPSTSRSPSLRKATASFATTILGGSPTTPPSLVCLDSPQSSESKVNVYHTPALKGDTGGPTGAGGRALDDASGLYPRWAALQSSPRSAQALSRARPSFPSDTGYVERTVQLECYWLDDDGCTTCDANSDGVISAEESWNDPDLLALGGIDAVDRTATA